MRDSGTLWFVIQVRPGKEETFRRMAKLNSASNRDADIVIPTRKIQDRKENKPVYRESVVFPGYVFVLCDHLSPEQIQELRGIEWFYRWLGTEGQPLPLPENEARFLQMLLSGGEKIGISTVSFDTNNKIQVASGPLKGLTGSITKVDRRKKRARVRIDLYEKAFEIDFGFELLEQYGEA